MGPARPAVEAVYGEAVELCERVEPSLDHVAAFWGWWRISPGITPSSSAPSGCCGLAQRLADDAVLLQAHHCLWATRFNLGDFEGSWRHIQAGLKLYEQGDYRAQADYFGGHDAQGLRQRRGGARALASRLSRSGLCATVSTRSNWSERLGHAGSRLHALDIAVTFRRYRREPEAARELAQRMIELGRERGLADHLAKGRLYLGWTVAAAGEREQGIAMIEEAFAIERDSGTPEDFSIYSDMLAETLVAAGRPGPRSTRSSGRSPRPRSGLWPIWLPELHRRRGEVLLALSAPRADEAEACFGEALSLARNQQSRALELRAATQPRPPVARGSGSTGRSRASCWARSTAGSPRVSTRPTCATPGASSRPWAAVACPASGRAWRRRRRRGLARPHRLVPPEETLGGSAASGTDGHHPRRQRHRTRPLGVPGGHRVRPNARSLAVSQGKGLTLAAAKVSAIMEAAELYHAETGSGSAALGAARASCRMAAAGLDPMRMPRSAAEPGYDGPIAWIEGRGSAARRAGPGAVRLRQRRLHAAGRGARSRARAHHRRPRRRQRPRRGLAAGPVPSWSSAMR